MIPRASLISYGRKKCDNISRNPEIMREIEPNPVNFIRAREKQVIQSSG
jgi:hypothetical protein